MKKCSKCQEEKLDKDFYIKNKKTGTLQSACIACHKIVSKIHYENNTELVKARSRSNRSKYKDRNCDIIINYLLANPCKCGETDILVLDFHHLDKESKVCEVSKLINSDENLLWLEIAKCQVLCANCHRRETHKDFNTYKWKYINMGL